MYHRIYKTLSYRDTKYMLTKSTDDSRLAGNNCHSTTCSQYFYVTYGKQYFHFVNWDSDNSHTAKFRIVDLSAQHLKIGIS